MSQYAWEAACLSSGTGGLCTFTPYAWKLRDLQVALFLGAHLVQNPSTQGGKNHCLHNLPICKSFHAFPAQALFPQWLRHCVVHMVVSICDLLHHHAQGSCTGWPRAEAEEYFIWGLLVLDKQPPLQEPRSPSVDKLWQLVALEELNHQG